ncbi:MAG: sugar transferase [Chloroflexi bacterium]|nr:sugar transferase [Chloroflexota bacterium]
MSTAQLELIDRPSTRPAEVLLHGSISAGRPATRLAGLAAFTVVLGDVAVVTLAFMVAYLARFADDTIPALGLERYLRLALLDGLLTAVFLATHGMYNLERPQFWSVRLRAVISSSSTALVLAITISYFLGDQAFSRLWLASSWLLAVVAVTVWRVLAHHGYQWLRDALAPTNRVVIVGANALGRQLAGELQGDYQVVGYVDNGSDLEQLERPLIGPIAQLEELVQAYAVDELVIALPANRREQISRVLARGFRRRVHVKLLPEIDDLVPRRFEVHELGGRRYIGFMPVAAVSWVKRAVDLVLVSFGLIVISPILVAIAIAIKLDTPGPVFYRQQRVGKDGRPFGIFKFRSMCQDAEHRLETLLAQNEASGPLFKMRNDPRVTRVGAVLRRWSLDELPQLLNVLRGEMSLVGPRPPIPSEVAKYEDWQLGRLRAMPGVTGLWQVSGRSEVPFLDMVRLDLHYIRNWSIGLDLEILLRTIPAVLTNRGAY